MGFCGVLVGWWVRVAGGPTVGEFVGTAVVTGGEVRVAVAKVGMSVLVAVTAVGFRVRVAVRVIVTVNCKVGVAVKAGGGCVPVGESKKVGCGVGYSDGGVTVATGV